MTPSIVLDATGLDTGHRTRGIGRYVQGLLEGLERMRATAELPVRVTLLRAPGGQALAAPVDGYPVATYPRWLWRGAASMWLENVARLDGHLPRGTDLYHATAMEGVARSVPWVATCHDLIPLILRGPYLKRHDLLAHLFWNRYAGRLANGARRVIAISDHVKGYLVERYAVPEERVDVIHHGLSPFWSGPDEGEPASASVREAAAEPFVLFVGGFDRRKNFPTVVEALARMPAGDRPRLLVVGVRSPTNRKRHAELGARLPEVDVRYLEYVDDASLRWLYRRSLGLVFPSIEEGWGFPIVEAMAAGAVVLCADFGSMAEAGGGAAVTVDVRSPEALADGIARLHDTGVRERSIRAGRERVTSLSWEACSRAVVASWQRALG